MQHPRIAGLLEHGTLPDGSTFVARAWVEGVDFARWALDHEPEEIAAVVVGLCEPLQALHEAGFAHGDLKAENVIVAGDGSPVLTDFEFARSHADEPTSSGGIRGTLVSIAPELLLGLPPTPTSDLFALGAMLHDLLAPQPVSPREFYGAFPARSFLDAAGTDPDLLPSWARDLVAALTARAPERRPRSARDVARMLADRIGLSVQSAYIGGVPDWPILLGRETWLDRLLGERFELPLWIRTPAGEDGRALFESVRVHASLRGRPNRGVELEHALATIANGLELDQWAVELARGPGDVLMCVGRSTAWTSRALEAARLALSPGESLDDSELGPGEENERPGLLVVSELAPPGPGWQIVDVPPVDRGACDRFANRLLSEEPRDRRAAFAERLDTAARGSADRASEVLAADTRAGLLLPVEGGARLRPGQLPSFARSVDEAAPPLEPSLIAVLEALDVVGEPTRPERLQRLLERPLEGLTVELRTLVEGGWVEWRPGAKDGRVHLRRSPRAGLLDRGRRQELHARHSSGLEDTSLRALHAYCAQPDEPNQRRLLEELETLRHRGRAERALELHDRLQPLLAAAHADLPPGALLLVEHARAWASIGRGDQALQVLAPLGDPETGEHAGSMQLVLGNIALYRHRTQDAIAAFGRAAELDPALAVEAGIGRLQTLHAAGRDQEVLDLAQELERDARALDPRAKATVHSLVAMSQYRTGAARAGLAATRELVRSAGARDDQGLHAALLINLALMERGAGSLQRARAALESSIRLYDEAGLVAGLAHARGALGGLLRDLGLLREAAEEIRSALEMRHRLGDEEGARTMRGMLGLVLFERGHARAAIETLEASAERMTGAQAVRFAPLLFAKAAEARARIGQSTSSERTESTDGTQGDPDPRSLVADARRTWMQGKLGAARVLAARARDLAASLGLQHEEGAAERLLARLENRVAEADQPATETLEALDIRVRELLEPHGFDPQEAEVLAADLTRRGRDDRAARLYLALAARVQDDERSREFSDLADERLRACSQGLTLAELELLKLHLLGEPDPQRGDLAVRPNSDDDLENEMIELLSINRQLVQQPDIPTLLRVIVEHALRVTGAERGFLVLEEDGELLFDTARDSVRGDLQEPEFEVSRTILADAFDRMAPILVSNAVDDPRLGHRRSVVELELRSILCVPFEIMPGLRGAIYADHRLRNGAFDERAEKLCTLLADQAALGIQQLRRLREIEDLNRSLEERVHRSERDLRTARIELGRREESGEEPGLLGNSLAMRDVRALLEKAAPSRLPVLLLGESGTGKEVAARMLHRLSPRKDEPFVSESCAALPASLIESELFGHVRGAFTGADQDRIGLVERAHGGTLFLDEIGEMPLELQAKLLRVLETETVRRVGENTPRAVEFRLVSATNRDLEEEVSAGRFRGDLFYRLMGLHVVLPPLTERPEDIPVLARHFLAIETSTGPERRLSQRMLAALARRRWPGNVRELRNEIARLCVLSEGNLDDPALISAPAAKSAGSLGPATTLAELEQRAILEALDRHAGDKRAAAAELGISRAKIYQRLKEWGAGGTD